MPKPLSDAQARLQEGVPRQRVQPTSIDNPTAVADNKGSKVVSDSNVSRKDQWLYSTLFSRCLRLDKLNQAIHRMQELPHCLEFVVFLCGYAMNPVVMPFWFTLAYWAGSVGTLVPFITSVLLTLLATEVCKKAFHTTRPENQLTNKHVLVRRYGKLVTSLKSKHSFPSGDSAQAANLCFYVLFYMQTLSHHRLLVCFAFACFLPGVFFARVFYLCHWVEDVIGGLMLAASLHAVVIPLVLSLVSTY